MKGSFQSMQCVMPLRLLLVGLIALAVSGCGGTERLSSAMATINRDYSQLQDEALLLNLVRRSASLPVHFTSLTVIRGRSRFFAGANLTVPFGGDAPSDFSFNPHMSVEQGPGFDVSTQDNQEFYEGYITAVSTTSLAFLLRQDYPPELILSLFLDNVTLDSDEGRQTFYNNPSKPTDFAAFQALINRLVDQGITMESVTLISDFGPALELKEAPSIDQLISARKQNLQVRPIGEQRYQLLEEAESARFCFVRPDEALFRQAMCELGAHREFEVNDPTFFGSLGGGKVYFDGNNGRVQLHTRSLAEVFDYLGELVRLQLDSGEPLTIRTARGAQPIVRVTKMPSSLKADSVAVSTRFGSEQYAIPSGKQAGQSGAVLSILSQLLAQVQSVKNMPVSNTVNLIGE